MRSQRLGVEAARPIDALAEPRDDHVARELGGVAAGSAGGSTTSNRIELVPWSIAATRPSRSSAWTGSTCSATQRRPGRPRPPGGTRSARAGTSRPAACRRRRRPPTPRADRRRGPPRTSDARASTPAANAGSARSCSLKRAIAPAASSRATAFPASGHVSQYVVGNGAPAASRGALRITSGCPPVQRTTTVNGVVGSRPSCSRTAARSDERSSRLVVPGTALMRRSSWQDRPTGTDGRRGHCARATY